MERLERRQAVTSINLVGTVYLEWSALPYPYDFEIKQPYDLESARGYELVYVSVDDGQLNYNHFGGKVPLDKMGFEETDYEFGHNGMRVVGSVYHAGDADRDGDVDFADFLRLSTNFGNEDAVWADGDFSLNGAVGFQDFLMLSANFGRGE